MRAAILSAPAVLLVLTACGSADPSIASVTVTPATVAAGDQISINVTVADFDLVSPDDAHAHGLRAAEGEHEHGEAAGDYPSEGHFHVYFDSIEENPLLLNCPTYCKHPGFAPTVTSTVPNDATAGAHKIIILLNDNSHMTLTPHIRGEATLTVQ